MRDPDIPPDNKPSVTKIVHEYKSNGCSYGHKFSIKTVTQKNKLYWVCICRRCGKTKENHHDFGDVR